MVIKSETSIDIHRFLSG